MSDALTIRRQHQLVLSGTGTDPKSLDDFDAVIVEILSWLPVKSLLRFRCVCKAWRALISESYFINKHLTHAKIRSNFNLIMKGDISFRSVEYQALLNSLSDDGPVPSIELDFPLFEYPCIETVGTCNGLVCLLYWQTPTMVLWNPTTRDSQVLPTPPIIPDLICSFGFGYDSTTDDYKIILAGRDWTHLTQNSEYVFVFTLKMGSWKKLESLTKYYDLDSLGYLVNETLHWVLKEHDEQRFHFPSKIVSFDLAEEKFHEIAFPYPPGVDRRELLADVGILGDCLTLYFQTMCGRAGCEFKMWVMKEYGVKDCWTQIIDLPSGILGEGWYTCKTCISVNGELLMRIGNAFGIYNPMEKTFRNLFDDFDVPAGTYIESLVSPLIGSTNGASL